MAADQRRRRAGKTARIDATIKITVPADKRMEILQTFRAILVPIRLELGCLSCNCYEDIEAENTLYFREEWRSRKNLESHLRSELFCVLTGAMSLLGSPPQIRLYTSDSTIAVEELQALRSSLLTERCVVPRIIGN